MSSTVPALDACVVLPAGEYRLGEGEGSRMVRLGPVLVGRWPVTGAHVRRFAEASGHRIGAPHAARLADDTLADHPATGLAYDDALAFCAWAGRALGRRVRLPTGDEWEAVANLYASIAATVNFIARQPRVFAEMLGKMLWWCGEDKIIYGGESPIWHPQWALEELWNFELPRDLIEEHGYPPLTEQAKRKILGENLARLHGIDAGEKQAALG